MTPKTEWPKIFSNVVDGALRGGRTDIDPRRDQEWWVLLERGSRSATFSHEVLADPEGAKAAVLALPPASSGVRLQLAAFYLLWRAFANADCAVDQRDLLRRATQECSTHDYLAADGGVLLLNGLRATLTADRQSSGVAELLVAYNDAKNCAAAFEGVLAFVRLRRFVGLRLFEKKTELEGEDVELRSALQNDFRLERQQLSVHGSPHLLAEALVQEARFLSTRHVRRYADALSLLQDAREVDTRAEGEEELAYRLRTVSYEQRILTIEAVAGLDEAKSEIRRDFAEHTKTLDTQIRTELEQTRRESIQMLGLLAAVVALISVLAGGRSNDSLDGILATSFAVTGMVVVAFSAFSVLFAHRPSGSWWPVLVPAIAGLALMAAALTMFAISPDSSRFGTPSRQPSVAPTP